MTGSNLTPYDYIIVQRGDKNYRISGDQILNFSMEQVQPQLDELEMALELEKALRERGDDANAEALENFLQRLEENINQVFPVQDSVFYDYRIDYPANAEFAASYYTCSGQPINIYPRVDEPPARCYSQSRESFHQNLADSILNKPGAFFLSTHDLSIGAIDALYINRYDSSLRDKSSVLEDNLLPGDVIQINSVIERDDGTTIVDSSNYGLFRIVEDKGPRAGDDGTGNFNPDKELYGFTLQLISGTVDVHMIPNREFQIRFLKSIVRTINDTYVIKTGDTMTGKLEIELVDITAEDAIDSNGNINTNTLSVEKSILLKDTNGEILSSGTINFKDDAGNVVVAMDDGTTGLLVNYDSGARYSTTIDLTDNEQLTHKLYVDTKDNELELELDKLSEKVDGLAQITQSTLNTFIDDGTYDSEGQAGWAQAVVDNDAIDANTFQMWSPAVESRPKGTAAATRVLVHEDYLPNNNFQWGDNVRTNDILEIVYAGSDSHSYHYAMYKLEPENEGDPSVVEYTLGDGKKVYELSVVFMRGQGNTLYGDENYKLNTYDRNTGLSIEATDERYVSIIGDIMSGPLTIDRKQEDIGPFFFKALGNTQTSFEVLTDGNVNARGGLELGYNDSNSEAVLKLPGAGKIEFGSSLLSNPEITVGGATKLQFVGNNIKFNSNRLQDLANPGTGSTEAQTAVTRSWFSSAITADKVTDPLCAIEVNVDNNSGKIALTGGGRVKLDDLDDTDVGPILGRGDGKVLGWNPQKNKWVGKEIGETYGPGQNLFVDAESKCEPGGMWTDKGSNPANPSYYIRVS